MSRCVAEQTSKNTEKENDCMIQQSHCWGSTPRELKAGSPGEVHTAAAAKGGSNPHAREWTNRTLSTLTADYYPTLKREEILTHATTWTHLEDMMLSEVSQSQKDTCCVIPHV